MTKSAPIVDTHLAKKLYQKAQPFAVVLKYQGLTAKGNRSEKWWMLSYDGTPNGVILCNHGRVGSRGREEPFQYSSAKAWEKCVEKLHKGYTYSPGTLVMEPQSTPITLEGVFTKIHFIDEVSTDHFKAYDKDGNFLLDLTKSGVEQILSTPRAFILGPPANDEHQMLGSG